jgi:hypothetical protein
MPPYIFRKLERDRAQNLIPLLLIALRQVLFAKPPLRTNTRPIRNREVAS